MRTIGKLIVAGVVVFALLQADQAYSQASKGPDLKALPSGENFDLLVPLQAAIGSLHRNVALGIAEVMGAKMENLKIRRHLMPHSHPYPTVSAVAICLASSPNNQSPAHIRSQSVCAIRERT